ncbi:crt homolog 2-like [Argopecten irradians]|uniref:crt homolog 2-like n=1 Tax=Argopecten irradians TaxID=31199 RepID=UPI003718E36A
MSRLSDDVEESRSLLGRGGRVAVNVSYNDSGDLYGSKNRPIVSPTVRNVIIAVLNVVTNVMMNVSLPVYADTMDQVGGGIFVLLMNTSITVSILFALLTILVRKTKLDPNASLKPKSSWKVLVAMGLFTTLNGILVVNASPSDRTPPYLQGILASTVIPYTVLCRLIILRKGISTVRALCTCVVLVGLFVSTEPQTFGLDGSGSGDSGTTPSALKRVLWPLCFALGFLPIGLSNVFCEKELKKDEGESLGFITWTNVFQFVTMVFFFWTDFVPGFGTSDSPSQFFTKFNKGFSCLFSSADSCHGLAGKAWIFNVGYVFGNLFQFLLIQYAEGSVFAVIVQAMVTPLATVFWTLFNYDDTTDILSWQPVMNATTGFTLAGLGIIVPGVFLYNYFSRKEAQEAAAQRTDNS